MGGCKGPPGTSRTRERCALRIHSAQFGCFGYAGYGQQVRAHTHIGLLLAGFLGYRAIRALHQCLQAFVDLVLGPEEALEILHPFKVTHRHTARVGQDIRDDSDTSLVEDFVGCGIGWAIGGLDNQLRFDARGVATR